MKRIIKIVCAILLLFNGIGALYGGWHLITHPDGSSIGLTLYWLSTSPFHNYLIPGIVLFICNGLLSVFVCYALFRNYKRGALLVAAQGIMLMGWIVAEVFLMHTMHYFHVILGIAGLALLFNGYLLYRPNNYQDGTK